MCVSVCLSVCPSPASDSSETVEVVIVKLGTVTASDMIMHHVIIILTLTFIQGYTDLNHENTKCLIISETIPAMLIKSAESTKGLYDNCLSHGLDLHSRSQVHLKLDYFLSLGVTF